MSNIPYNSCREIGGYFQLELNNCSFLHDDAILLGSGRQCLEYILSSNIISKIFVPRYTCESVYDPINRLKLLKDFYEINDNLEIVNIPNLKTGEYLLYTNYFGIKDEYIDGLAKYYGRKLIIDSSQAYYSKPWDGSHTFYSPRKFFGLPDGGCLYTDSRINHKLSFAKSYKHCSHLLKRIDINAKAGYKDFNRNEIHLKDKKIQMMSQLTRKLLANIDFLKCAEQRISNYNVLHEALTKFNEFKTLKVKKNVPMVYPFMTRVENIRSHLIKNKIFVASYWPNVIRDCEINSKSYELASKIIPLPIDQRYGIEEMKVIIEAIIEYIY